MKTLNISDEAWKKLFSIKINKDHKTIDETIKYLLDSGDWDDK